MPNQRCQSTEGEAYLALLELYFCTIDALLDAEPTLSEHCRGSLLLVIISIIVVNFDLFFEADSVTELCVHDITVSQINCLDLHFLCGK